MLTATISWFRKPCEWYQILFCLAQAVCLLAYMESRHVYWGFSALVFALLFSLVVGMTATRMQWRWLEWISLSFVIGSFGWICLWLYFHWYT